MLADAIFRTFDRGGLSPLKAADAPSDGEKPIDEMTMAELEAFIREKESKLPDCGQASGAAPDAGRSSRRAIDAVAHQVDADAAAPK